MKLSRVNTLLFIIIIGMNLHTVILPVLPAMLFWYRANYSDTTARLSRTIHAISLTSPSQPAPPQGDRIIIPSMQLDQPIHTGRDMRTLNKGLWLRPVGSTPDKGSNTVIVGHRFTYTNPRATFYFLDRVRPGDEIGIFWHGKKYLYRVSKTAVVPASATEIEAPTNKAQLTLYTCTPLWNPQDRLAVTALLEDETP